MLPRIDKIETCKSLRSKEVNFNKLSQKERVRIVWEEDQEREKKRIEEKERTRRIFEPIVIFIAAAVWIGMAHIHIKDPKFFYEIIYFARDFFLAMGSLALVLLIIMFLFGELGNSFGNRYG
ncbi:MAG: hypothetical protein JWM20_519 [Patescibacteria group bacterium]|nr:hypothetical protein [Patescibacteria group bacterium]